jgi:GH24 family phage-related lysozyme (muramidase)
VRRPAPPKAQPQARQQARQPARPEEHVRRPELTPAQEKARQQAERQARRRAEKENHELAEQQARMRERIREFQQARSKEQAKADPPAPKQTRPPAHTQATPPAQKKSPQTTQRPTKPPAGQVARAPANGRGFQERAAVKKKTTARGKTATARAKAAAAARAKEIARKEAQKRKKAQDTLARLNRTNANLLARQKKILKPLYAQGGAPPPDWDRLWADLLSRSPVDFTTKRTAVDPDAPPADGPFDVVFTYPGGDVGHHTFYTWDEAKQFADEYSRGVYSTADGTIKSIQVYALGKERVDAVSAARLAFDENAPKRKAEAAVRADVQKAVADDPLLRQLVRQEGVRLTPYQDSVKLLTTAIGFNMEANGAADRLRAVGLDFNRVAAGVQVPTAPQMVQLLNMEVRQARETASNTAAFTGDDLGLPLVPNYATLTQQQKDVMVNMIFNMGPGGPGTSRGLGGFRGMRRALAAGDTLRAAAEMIDSGWYDQVGPRSRELVEQMGMDRDTQQAIRDVLQQRRDGDLTRKEAKKQIDAILKPLRDQQQPPPNPPGVTVPPLTALPAWDGGRRLA